MKSRLDWCDSLVDEFYCSDELDLELKRLVLLNLKRLARLDNLERVA